MITDTHIAEAERLLAILQREHQALLHADLEQIEAIVREKQIAAQQFEAVTRFLQGQSLADVTGSPERARRLAELAVACRRQNEINGAMVAAGLRHTQQVLSLLKGQTPGEGLYSRAGGTSPGTATGRPLASA